MCIVTKWKKRTVSIENSRDMMRIKGFEKITLTGYTDDKARNTKQGVTYLSSLN